MKPGRVIFVALMLVVGGIYGGAWGVYSMFLISALLVGVFCHAPQQSEQPERVRSVQTADDFKDDVVITGIKGHRDPTRPDADDYAAMITDNYGRRRM